MSLFDADEEIRRQREMLAASAEVSGQMIDDAPNVAVAESLLPVPLSPIEKMMERDGKGKTFGKMLLGGMTGLTPFLMPELIGGNARYKAELDVYNDARKRQLTSQQASPFRGQLQNDSKEDDLEALEKLAELYPDIYGPVLSAMLKKQYAPVDETMFAPEYQQDPETGDWQMVQTGNQGTTTRTSMGDGFIPASQKPGPEYVDKAIDVADQAYRSHSGNANEALGIIEQMDSIGKENWGAVGIRGEASEFYKAVTGTEDFVSTVRKNYQDVKVRNAISNLPPGVASDKDIELALSPWPESTSDFDFIKRKLEAIARLEEGRAAYSRFESQWIATNGRRNGLQDAWSKTETAQRVKATNTPSRTWEFADEETS
jgi:hypothetical protein